MENVHYLGAIAVGGIIFNFIYWGFGFLRMGTTGLTAQACGRQDDRESISVLSRALLTALFFSLLLILFRNFIVDLSFDLIDASEEVERYGRLYFSIRILAAPATLGLYALTGWFLGMQNARYPLYLALVTNAFNIIFDLVFIKVFDMNVDGVALGTVCANFLGILTAFWLFYRSYGSLRIHIKAAHILDWGRFREFFRVGRDIFIRTLILIFAFSFFTAKSAESGDLLLAVNTILINLWTIMAYGIDGFAFAAESVVGRYIGARQPQNLKKAIWYSFAWGGGVGALFSGIYLIFPRPILQIFTDNQAVIALAMHLIIWTQIAPLLNTICYIWDGIFIGATATAAMRNSMIISLAVFYLPVYYIGITYFGGHALWAALTVFMFARGLTLSLFYKKSVLGRISA
jgi:multidrug resistance protein, MATE family